MHHFFVEPQQVTGDRVVISGREGFHAARVLRLRVRETISVADGTGRVLHAVVTRVLPEAVEARVIVAHQLHPPRPALTLYQAVCKGERTDFAIQKAVELGARRIVPFVAERTVVRWDEPRRRRAAERWAAVALAAAKQSRTPFLPEVAPVACGVEACLGGGGLVVALHEGSKTLLREALPPEAPEAVGVVVGPEGGLSPREVEVLAEGGARVVSLGERILRAETAGPVALALVSFAYGNIG